MVVVNLQTLNPSTIQLDVYTGKYGIHIPQKTTIMSFSHISKNKITTQKKKKQVNENGIIHRQMNKQQNRTLYSRENK